MTETPAFFERGELFVGGAWVRPRGSASLEGVAHARSGLLEASEGLGPEGIAPYTELQSILLPPRA